MSNTIKAFLFGITVAFGIQSGFGQDASSDGAPAPQTTVKTRPIPRNTRSTYPTAVSAELLGRGLLYSVQVDQSLTDRFSAGIGFSTNSAKNPTTDNSTGETAVMLPAYVNYYFSESGQSPFVTGSMTVLTNSSKVKGQEASTSGLKFPSDSIMPSFGVGYESRSETGFLVRVTAYALVGENVRPWVGFTAGFAF